LDRRLDQPPKSMQAVTFSRVSPAWAGAGMLPRGQGRPIATLAEGAMDEFVSTFTNRLDAKGRVSIPASFRAVLSVDGFDGLYCCPTLDRQAVDAGGNLLRQTIRASLAAFAPFSADHEFLSTTLIGESEILKIDQDGRVVLSEAIRAHAGIAERVTFVGQGYKFQIWEPERFAAYRDEAKNRLRDIRNRLAPGHPAAGVLQRSAE
jgi:MraZ protein